MGLGSAVQLYSGIWLNTVFSCLFCLLIGTTLCPETLPSAGESCSYINDSVQYEYERNIWPLWDIAWSECNTTFNQQVVQSDIIQALLFRSSPCRLLTLAYKHAMSLKSYFNKNMFGEESDAYWMDGCTVLPPMAKVVTTCLRKAKPVTLRTWFLTSTF